MISVLHILTPATPFSFRESIIVPAGGEPIRLYYRVPKPVAINYTVGAPVDIAYSVPKHVSLIYDMNSDGGL